MRRKTVWVAFIAALLFLSSTWPVLATPLVAKPTAATILVDGTVRDFTAYEIKGNNYFKLRDLAFVLSGSAKQFEVTWEEDRQAISLTSGKGYTPIGGEMTTQNSGGDKTAFPSTAQLYLNEQAISFTAYEINDSNYFKLRDILETFDIGVTWSEATQTIVISTANHYQAEGMNDDELSVEEISRYAPSVLLLTCYDSAGNAICTGTAFFIDSAGTLVTNYHVVAGAASIKARTDAGDEFAVDTMLAYDAAKDIAVLGSSASNTSPLQLGDSDTVVLGQSVVAIGNPLGLQNTVSSGIISSIRRLSDGALTKEFQITTPLSHGSSGGPLFNNSGEVIGITYASLDLGQNINFAIPINEIKPLLEQKKARTLKEVAAEQAVVLQDLSKLLMQKYSAPMIAGQQITIDEIEIEQDEEDYTMLYCFISLENEASIAALKNAWASVSGRQQLQSWCYNMVSTIREKYPDYEIFGAVTAYQIFDTLPAENFEIMKKDPDSGKWLTAQTLWYWGWDEEGFFTISQKK